MIKRETTPDGAVRVTFAIEMDACPEDTSVAGDFNGWDPLAHPMKKRSNGTRSAAVELAEGQVVEFRYLSDGGVWFCDDTVDVNENGNNILTA